MLYIKGTLLALAMIVLFFANTSNVIAAPAASGAPSPTNASACNKSTIPMIPTWYQYLSFDTNCEIINPDGKAPILIMMGIFDIILFLAGFIAVIIVIWGGFKLLTSTGEPQKIAAGRTTIVNALVGLAIAIIASQIVGFIAGRLG